MGGCGWGCLEACRFFWFLFGGRVEWERSTRSPPPVPLARSPTAAPPPPPSRLSVAGAFHTDYMSPAVGKLKEALAATSMSAPRIPVISNVDGQPHSDPAVIKEILAKQARARSPAVARGRCPPHFSP